MVVVMTRETKTAPSKKHVTTNSRLHYAEMVSIKAPSVRQLLLCNMTEKAPKSRLVAAAPKSSVRGIERNPHRFCRIYRCFSTLCSEHVEKIKLALRRVAGAERQE